MTWHGSATTRICKNAKMCKNIALEFQMLKKREQNLKGYKDASTRSNFTTIQNETRSHLVPHDRTMPPASFTLIVLFIFFFYFIFFKCLHNSTEHVFLFVFFFLNDLQLLRPSGWSCKRNLHRPASFQSNLDFVGRRINQQGLEQTLESQSEAADIPPPTAQRQTAHGLSAAHTTKTLELLPHGCVSLCAGRVAVYIHVRQYKIWWD